MNFGLFFHPFNFVFRQPRGTLDADGLHFAGGFVFGRNRKNAVSINVKSNFYLRHAPRRRRQTVQNKPAQSFIVGGHRALALQHMNLYLRLAVGRGGKCLGFSRGYGGVFAYQHRHHAAQRFQTERQGSHIQQQHVFDIALQNSGLHRRAQSHHFVGVDVFVRLFAEKFFDGFLYSRHPGLPAHQNNLVDVGKLKAGISHCLARNFHRTVYFYPHQILQL